MNGDEPRVAARSAVDHPYRRVLLALLDATEPPVSVRDLARGVLAYERGGLDRPSGPHWSVASGEPRVESAENVETMAAQLHHVHLPLLDAAGVVQYDPTSTEVTDWYHPNVGDRWVAAPPIDSLVDVLRTTDVQTPRARRSRGTPNEHSALD